MRALSVCVCDMAMADKEQQETVNGTNCVIRSTLIPAHTQTMCIKRQVSHLLMEMKEKSFFASSKNWHVMTMTDDAIQCRESTVYTGSILAMVSRNRLQLFARFCSLARLSPSLLSADCLMEMSCRKTLLLLMNIQFHHSDNEPREEEEKMGWHVIYSALLFFPPFFFIRRAKRSEFGFCFCWIIRNWPFIRSVILTWKSIVCTPCRDHGDHGCNSLIRNNVLLPLESNPLDGNAEVAKTVRHECGDVHRSPSLELCLQKNELKSP